MLQDHAFQVDGGDPFATGLDHVLDAVNDLQPAVFAHHRHISGVQPTAGPQFLGFLRVVQVPLGQPGGANHHFPLALAIVGHVVHFPIDDTQLHHGHRTAGAGAVVRLGFQVGLFQFRGQLCQGQQRTGLTHAVAGIDVDAALQRAHGQGLGQGGTTNDHFPATQVDALGRFRLQQHLDDGGYTVGEGDLLGDQQFQQTGRLITTRVHLLHTHQGGHVGNAPGMHVEHGGNRHVDIVFIEATLTDPGHGVATGKGMQYQLTVGEVHTLGQPGGTGGVKGGGAGVFIQLGEIITGRRLGQQVLVLTGDGQRIAAFHAVVVEQNVGLHRLDAVLHRFQDRQEFAVHQDGVILGVVDGVEHLFRAEPHIHGVQYRPHHGNGEKRLQVTVGVPVHHRHGVAGLDALGCQGAGQTVYPLFKFPVGKIPITVGDGLLRRLAHAGFENAVDYQRRLHGGGGALDSEITAHSGSVTLLFCR